MNTQDVPPAHDANTVGQEFKEWFSSPVGRTMLATQRYLVEQATCRYFGYHQLEILLDQDLGVAENSLLGHRIVAVPELNEHKPDRVLVCQSHELPLVSDSIDLVVLHHTLDVSPEPHQTLREVCRVLRSSGNIVIIGFNPFSTWGMRKYLFRSKRAPWNGRFISPARLEDWLTLLDFQLHQIRHCFYAPPVSSLRWLSRLDFLNRLGEKLNLPVGAFYVIQAQKRVGGMIPLKPRWQRNRSVAGAAVVHQFTPYRKNEKN